MTPFWLQLQLRSLENFLTFMRSIASDVSEQWAIGLRYRHCNKPDIS